MTFVSWKMLRRSWYMNKELYSEILESAKNNKYKKGFYERVHIFLKNEKIIDSVIFYLKKEKYRMLKEIKTIENLFDQNNPNIKQGFAMWKISLNILTHNKFIKQLKIDYEIKN